MVVSTLIQLQLYLISKMEKLEQLKLDFKQTLKRNIPHHVKKLILQGIVQQLKYLQKTINQRSFELQINSCIKTEKTCSTLIPSLLSNTTINDTATTLSESSLIACNLNRDDLETKIIQKQRKKYHLNEEIQTLEEEYFERQKILMTKKDFYEELDSQITRKTYQITKKSCLKRQKLMVVQQERQSLSSRLKLFFLG